MIHINKNLGIILAFAVLGVALSAFALYERKTIEARVVSEKVIRLTSLQAPAVSVAATLPTIPSSDSTARLTAVGDLMFDRNVKARMEKYGQEYPLANVTATNGHPFNDVDILLGNLEGSVSVRRPPVKSIDFAFDKNIPSLLREHGFTAVSDANNHGLDQGRAGFVDTQNALRGADVGFFGDPVNDDTEPWVTTVKGKHVAVFGYNITDNKLDEAAAEAHIRTATKANDIVIVFMHWGTEYAPVPPQAVRDLGRRFIDWGATAVIGSHPHVMEGMELWKGRPILWSLGNFVFDQDWSVETQHGLVITLGISDNHFSLELYPTDINKSQPVLAAGDERATLLNTFAERSTLPDALLAQAKTGTLEWSSDTSTTTTPSL